MTEYLPEDEWRSRQPKKLVGAKIVLRSTNGNVLLVKPTYKPTWQLPGGVVEAGESPLVAAMREVCEETGLVCDGVDARLAEVIAKTSEDTLLIMYEYTKAIDEARELAIQLEELEAYEWVTPDKVAERLPEYYASFCQQYIK
jgi:8-oxo-dGTP diphosphatase